MSFVGLLAAIVLLFAGMIASWETAEVMVLHHLDEHGESVGTRLWVVDWQGYPSFVVSPDSKRAARLRKYPDVELERGGRTECRNATILSLGDDPSVEARREYEELAREVRRLYDEKYGFRIPLAFKLVSFLLGGASQEEPALVRLEPCEDNSL